MKCIYCGQIEKYDMMQPCLYVRRYAPDGLVPERFSIPIYNIILLCASLASCQRLVPVLR